MGFFESSNYAEAALWGAIGVAFSLVALRTRKAIRGRCAAASVALLAFGGSDVVEASTGAWWDPWWLLLWKAACVGVLAALVFDYYRRRRGEKAVRNGD
jgi:hypothetical protein